jgi:O-acetyl-ADP-ribose deacetylase (regulator of RNase III)
MRSRVVLAFASGLELDLVMAGDPPPATAAVVVPQDVHRILGEVTTVEDPRERVEDVARAAVAPERPARPGTIVVVSEGEGPLVVEAIVYDFERVPPALEIHVFEALLATFEEARGRGLRTLAVPPLGTSHGGLPAERFLRLLVQVCYSAAEMGTPLRQVHLLVPSPDELAVYEALLPGLLDRSRI